MKEEFRMRKSIVISSAIALLCKIIIVVVKIVVDEIDVLFVLYALCAVLWSITFILNLKKYRENKHKEK